MNKTNRAKALPTNTLGLFLIVGLLLLQFFLRAHKVTGQYAFIDESFHNQRAAVVWTFQVNPGEFANGKILVYYWMGLFSGTRDTWLWTSRTAVALFSIITTCGLYLLGRWWLKSRSTAILVTILYIFLPLTLFHERMALADPLTTGIGVLLAWRCLIFIHRPTRKQGVVIGALLALVTLSKLTAALLPLLPVIGSIIYFPVHSEPLWLQIKHWFARYFVPLLVAAITVVLCWLPILIPALVARLNGADFTLVNNVNLGTLPTDIPSPEAYLQSAINGIANFTSSPFLLVAGICAVYLLLTNNEAQIRAALYLIFWLALSVLLTFAFATYTSARYYLLGAAPLVLLIAYGISVIWEHDEASRTVRVIILGFLTVWMITTALPYIYFAFQDPLNQPLTSRNAGAYLRGLPAADTAVVEGGKLLDLIPPEEKVYADFTLCNQLYFYTMRELTCLDDVNMLQALATHISTELRPGQIGYFAMRETNPRLTALMGVCIDEPTSIRGPKYVFRLWKLHNGPC